MFQAIAGEFGLPMIQMASTELVSGVSGETEEKIRQLFQAAKQNAPCILVGFEIFINMECSSLNIVWSYCRKISWNRNKLFLQAIDLYIYLAGPGRHRFDCSSEGSRHEGDGEESRQSALQFTWWLTLSQEIELKLRFRAIFSWAPAIQTRKPQILSWRWRDIRRWCCLHSKYVSQMQFIYFLRSSIILFQDLNITLNIYYLLRFFLLIYWS